MSDYTYPNTGFTFGARDQLAPGNSEKVIKGVPFDEEFNALVVAINSKLNTNNPAFTGIMTGGTMAGDIIVGGIVDGGTF